MRTASRAPTSIDDYRALDTGALVALLAEKDARLAATKSQVNDQKTYIRILEEYLRLAKARRFGASSEKLGLQIGLFDEAELEEALAGFEEQLPKEPDSSSDNFTLIGKITGFNHVVNKPSLFIGESESNSCSHNTPLK